MDGVGAMQMADDIGKLWLEDQRRMMVAASMPYAEDKDTKPIWREVSNPWADQGTSKMVLAEGKRAELLDRIQHQEDESNRQRSG